MQNEGFADVVFGLTKPFPNNLTELWTIEPAFAGRDGGPISRLRSFLSRLAPPLTGTELHGCVEMLYQHM